MTEKIYTTKKMGMPVMLQRQQASAIIDARKMIVNGQIEYLLTECVRQRKKDGKYVGEEIDVPPKFDLH